MTYDMTLFDKDSQHALKKPVARLHNLFLLHRNGKLLLVKTFTAWDSLIVDHTRVAVTPLATEQLGPGVLLKFISL